MEEMYAPYMYVLEKLTQAHKERAMRMATAHIDSERRKTLGVSVSRGTHQHTPVQSQN